MHKQEQLRRDSIRSYIKANNCLNKEKIYGYKFTTGNQAALYFKVLNPFTGKLYYRWQGYLSNVFAPSGNYKGDT